MEKTREEVLEEFKSSLTSKEREQLETLLKLRGRLAYAKQMLPYQVFRDKELYALMHFKPMTLEALGKIKGFPPDGNRVNNYGDSIIAVFNTEVDDFEIIDKGNGKIGVKPIPCKRMESF